MADKIKLKVSIGPDYENRKVADVNCPDRPTRVQSERFDGYVVVRVKGFQGYTTQDNDAPAEDKEYFSQTDHTSSIQFRGIFKGDIAVDDVLFGNDFDKPIRDALPYGTWAAIKALQTIDPSIDINAYDDKPNAFSPLFATMNVIRVTPNESDAVPDEKFARISEDTKAITAQQNQPSKSGDRKKYFQNQMHRQNATVGPHHIVEGDFSNPFLDFNSFSINLPYVGWSIPALKYWDGQPLRYTCKSRKTNEVFFCVVFELFDQEGNMIDDAKEVRD